MQTKIMYKGVNIQSAMESVWSIQKRIYAVLPEEALSMGSNTIPRKKLHHGELQAKSICYELASFCQALT